MTRITISNELYIELNKIRSSQWDLRHDRGLDGVVAFLVDDYKSRKTVEQQIIELKETIIGTMETAAKKGTTKAFNQWTENLLLSLKGT